MLKLIKTHIDMCVYVRRYLNVDYSYILKLLKSQLNTTQSTMLKRRQYIRIYI